MKNSVNHIGIIGLGILMMTSCWRDIPVEDPILSEEAMVPVLKDIHLAESLLAPITDRLEKDSLARIYYTQIFRLHDVDEADFEQSMNAYYTNPGQIDTLYTKVINALAKENKEIEKRK